MTDCLVSSLLAFVPEGRQFRVALLRQNSFLFWFQIKTIISGDLQKTPDTIMKVEEVSSAGNKHVYGSLPVQALNWMVGN